MYIIKSDEQSDLLFVYDRVLLCGLNFLNSQSFASASWLLGVQMWTTIPGPKIN